MSKRKDKLNELLNNIGFSTENTKRNQNNMYNLFLNKTLVMFKYENCSIDYIEMEKILQNKGKCFIMEYKGSLVALEFEYINDKVDVYGNSENINVHFKDTNTYEVKSIIDGVIMKNDALELGFSDLFDKYVYLINESDVTMDIVNFWKRTEKIFTANNDNIAESVKKYLEDTKGGKQSVIVTNLLLEAININSSKNESNTIHELIEYNKYLKSQFYSEIGLYTNENMKKERLITSEVENNMTSIYPLVDNMYQERKKSIDIINERYNCNIVLNYNSSWDYRNSEDNNLKSRDEESNTEVEESNTEVEESNTEVEESNTEVEESNTEVEESNTEVEESNTEVEEEEEEEEEEKNK